MNSGRIMCDVYSYLFINDCNLKHVNCMCLKTTPEKCADIFHLLFQSLA